MYSEKVMDHFTNPRNVGEIENANAVGQVGNPKCGDIMKIYMQINASVATSSMATEMVKGKTIDEALEITNVAVAEALDGLPPVKMHCSNLAQEAIHSAIADYYNKKGIDPTGIVGCNGDCACCHGHHHESEEE